MYKVRFKALDGRRGWGRTVYEVKMFDTKELAEMFCAGLPPNADPVITAA